MRKLFHNNFGLRSIIFYILICILVVGMSVFVLQNHQLIITNNFNKVSFVHLYYDLLLISFLILVTTFVAAPIFFFEYLRNENYVYSVVKLLPYLPIISVFCVFLALFNPEFYNPDGVVNGSSTDAILCGLAVLIVAIGCLHVIKYFHYSFKNAMVFAYNRSYSKGGEALSLDEFVHIANREKQVARDVEDPNEELIKRVEKLINDTEEHEVEPIGDINLNIVMYIYGDAFDYCLLDSGLDIPFMFGDEDPTLVLAECHFLHINIALYIRVDQVYVFNFDENYVILNPAVDRNLHHIRSKRVKEKLNSYRVPGKPSGYFHIHPDLAANLRLILDKYAN